MLKKILQNTNLITESKNNIVLIETQYIEYFTEENGKTIWKSLSIPSLPFIPVIIKSDIAETDEEIIYILKYELPYTHKPLTAKAEEKYILDKDNKFIKHSIAYIRTPYNNQEYTDQIRYNNENIETLSKTKHQETVLPYINNKRKILFKLHNALNSK